MIGKTRATKHGKKGKQWLPSRLRGNSRWSVTLYLCMYSVKKHMQGPYTLMGIRITEKNCIATSFLQQYLSSYGFQRSMRYCLALKELMVSAYPALFCRRKSAFTEIQPKPNAALGQRLGS
jgi:hypothetical protein